VQSHEAANALLAGPAAGGVGCTAPTERDARVPVLGRGGVQGPTFGPRNRTALRAPHQPLPARPRTLLTAAKGSSGKGCPFVILSTHSLAVEAAAPAPAHIPPGRRTHLELFGALRDQRLQLGGLGARPLAVGAQLLQLPAARARGPEGSRAVTCADEVGEVGACRVQGAQATPGGSVVGPSPPRACQCTGM
jgi:hypothetical protein